MEPTGRNRSGESKYRNRTAGAKAWHPVRAGTFRPASGVLQRRWDRTFSEHSYGFRPGRSAHQAVEAAQEYIANGYRFVVDLLEKFFDRVNHDRLLAKIAERVSDKRLLQLVRAFLQAGVREGGLVSPADEGTPQGGPLSPLLSNIVLEQKSAVARPWQRKFLGFSFTSAETPKRRIAPKAVVRLKERIRELTRRARGVSTEQMAKELTRYLRGWIGYFGNCETPSVLQSLEE